MKKIIALLAVVALVVCGFAMTVNAAISPETDGNVKIISAKYPSGKDARLKIVKAPNISDDLSPKSDDEVLIGQYTVENADGVKDYPITVRVNVAGVKASSKVTVLAKKTDGTIVTLDAKVISAGVVEFQLKEEYSALSFIKAKAAVAPENGKAPQTGDVATPIVVAVLMFAALGMAVSYKKVRA